VEVYAVQRWEYRTFEVRRVTVQQDEATPAREYSLVEEGTRPLGELSAVLAEYGQAGWEVQGSLVVHRYRAEPLRQLTLRRRLRPS
jgi:hypothetical protein